MVTTPHADASISHECFGFCTSSMLVVDDDDTCMYGALVY